jgi:hypothetical protein
MGNTERKNIKHRSMANFFSLHPAVRTRIIIVQLICKQTSITDALTTSSSKPPDRPFRLFCFSRVPDL